MAEELEEYFGDTLDPPTFDQILEMDDDDPAREFSNSIVFGFFEQAASTFEKMDEALQKKDLQTLSNLGHYLKGSSATIGFNKVKVECEKIQNFGDHKDESGLNQENDETKLLALIKDSIQVAKHETGICERLMRGYYQRFEQE